MTSFCDPSIFDEDTITRTAKCHYNDDIREMLSVLFEMQKNARFLSRLRAEINHNCISARGWPFSQKCEDSFCNYKWSLSMNPPSGLFTLNPFDEEFVDKMKRDVGYRLIEESSSENIWDACQSFRTDKGRDEFAYGGFWAYRNDDYTSFLIPTAPVPVQDSKGSKFDDCGHLSTYFPDGFIFGAIPNYALKPDLPKCAALVDDVSLWGPGFSSDKRLKTYAANLACSSNSKVSSHFTVEPDPVKECWSYCHDEAKLKPIFFFTVIESTHICRCFSTW